MHGSTFKNHKFKHTGEGPPKIYLCTICQKGFARDKDRKRHEEIHNTELKYECEICGKKFRTKQCYDVHKNDLHRSKYKTFQILSFFIHISKNKELNDPTSQWVKLN